MARRAVERVPRRRRGPVGSETPRIAPPVPLKHHAKELAALAAKLEQPFWPWQQRVARYLTAENARGRWLYREVAWVVARQNGKTTILDTGIIERMLAGARVMHTAQNRDLPRETHERLATLLERHFPRELPRGAIKYGSGKEGIELASGGSYRIVAPTRSGARGPANDLVVVDEVLELEDFDFISAAKPTLTASAKPQMWYLSNAGHAMSAVLNSLRARGSTDSNLAYLEWSAEAGRAPDDVNGWCEANPSIGHNPNMLENLQAEYQANVLGGTMDVWEREHLCRWTVAKTERLITPEEWSGQVFLDERPTSVRPAMGIKMDPSGNRMSAVIAWPGDTERVNLDIALEARGDPIDVERLGPDLAKLAKSLRVSTIAFDPATDADLMRHMTRATTSITGRDYASATERFVRLVAGRKLVVHDPGSVLAADLECTTRRAMTAGTAIAVKAGSDMTNTAAEAAIRAVWAAASARPRLMIY